MEQWINGETVSIALFLIGFYGLLARRNIIKSIIALGIIQSAIILFFLDIHHSAEQNPPIGIVTHAADPLPQGLMITAVIIGISVTAVSLTMFITLYHRYGTTNWLRLKKRREDQ